MLLSSHETHLSEVKSKTRPVFQTKSEQRNQQDLQKYSIYFVT